MGKRKRLREKISRAALGVANAFLWLWTGASKVMDWIGRSTVVGDAQNAGGLIESALMWLLATPWYVPATLATMLTGLLVYLNWPRETFRGQPRSLKRMSEIIELRVHLAYDDEARVWYVAKSDIPGLSLEAASPTKLVERIAEAVPELLELNDGVRVTDNAGSG